MRSKVAPWVVALLAVAPLGGRVQAQRAGALPAADSSLLAGTPEEAARRWADETRAVVEQQRRLRWAPEQGEGAELGISFKGRF
ncbi:MAG: hypothetical protein HYW52_01050, partial [Gemmatimonadetes bacterium]|nr:hypothetical protein [Gemmatimonadota bacterium]